jgi:hypothetical protein
VSSLAFFAELVDRVPVLFEILYRIHVDVTLVEEGACRSQREGKPSTVQSSETVSFQAHGLQDGVGRVQTRGEGWGEIVGDFDCDLHT